MSMAFGATDAFNALIYGAPRADTAAYLAERLKASAGMFLDKGQQFVQRAWDNFNRFNGTQAIQFARQVVSESPFAVDVNIIQRFYKLSDFQNANATMQRWIMANPVVRKLYAQQRCDGYSDTYIDVDPGCIGFQQYDYRRATEGILIEELDGGWVAHQYFEENDLREGDRHLTIDEKMDILETWRNLEALMALAKDDPTSPSGAEL